MRLSLVLPILLLLTGCSGRPGEDLHAILDAKNLTAMCPWKTAGKDLVAAARIKYVKEEGRTFYIRYIEVFDMTGGKAGHLFSTGEVGPVVNLYTLGEKGEPLVAVTRQGENYRIIAYHYRGGKVEQVLDMGSQRQPEVLRTNDSDDPLLLVTDTQRHPWQTFRLRWTGERFNLDKTALYPQRLR